MIERITIHGGRTKDGQAEAVSRVELLMGEMVSIVGPTGSGKTTLINDLELFAKRNTPTGRQILLDGRVPNGDFQSDPASHPIALITQHTSFLSDLPVEVFLSIHARVRNSDTTTAETRVRDTLAFANELTGEPILAGSRMTELSGGQTRALLLADAAVICSTPVVLLDEVENAGIHRQRALERLRQHRKLFLFVTHDPRIVLLSDCRIVMRNGGMVRFLRTTEEERTLSEGVIRIDDALTRLRDRLRRGEGLGAGDLEAIA